MKHAPLLALLAAVGLSACGPDLAAQKDATPRLDLARYFDGDLTAHGVFQDSLGNLRRSFVVKVHGVPEGDRLTLTEDFVYEDGSTEERVWHLHRTGPGGWAGTAGGVVGEAKGRELGNAFNWDYTIDLKTPSGPLRASFDDWIWQLDDRVAVNRAYVTKLGVPIGSLSIFFRRETPEP